MRFFVNTQHPLYREVAKANANPELWLGNPSDIDTPEIGDSLGRNPGEIFFYDDQLRNVRRKLQVIFDSFVNPKIFIDGALNEKEVERLLKAEVEADRVRGLGAYQTSQQVAVGTLAGTGLAIAGGLGGAAIAGASAGSVVPVIGTIIGGIVGIVGGVLYGSHARAGAEDNMAPWLFTSADFPWTTGQAIKGNNNIRSLKRLYDDRKRATRDFPNDRAIALLLNSTMADALFGNSKNHPDPRTDDRDLGSRREGTLKAYFGFTERGGVNQTYVDAVIRIGKYLFLIDQILKFDDLTLSRPIDVEEATITSSPVNISLSTFKVRLYSTLQTAAEQVIKEKVYTYMNPDREYKTLLNAGNDRQYVIESWRKSPSVSGSLQFKLLTPLDSSTRTNDSIYVSREIAKSVIDTIDFELGPEVDVTPYLRPGNTNVGNYVPTKKLTDVTLSNLDLTTGSQGFTSSQAVSYEDTIFRRWYTADFNSSELNIDFTKYDNFVQYGSAYLRLTSFYNKLRKIEELTSTIKGTTILDQQRAQEKEIIIRNFDPYEQYLFYATASAYSASAFYVDNNVEYNATGSWPKQSNGTVHPTTSSIAIDWFTTQSAIAQRYDDFNENYLTKHLPSHIQEDEQSAEFMTFVGMFGHVMDNVKEYIDQFPNIYSTNIDPYKELTMDQVYEVATSFGLNLPNAYSLNSLQGYFASIYGEQGSRSLVAETWKRFLHAMSFIYKSKGTKTAFETVLSTYGIRTPMLQIKESSYPATDNYISSEELTYGLNFSSVQSSSIINSTPAVDPSVITIRFIPSGSQTSNIIGGWNSTSSHFAVQIVPHPSASKEKYGRIQILSNSIAVASSSYFKLFDTDYTFVGIRSQSADYVVAQTDGTQLLYIHSGSTNIPGAIWQSALFWYVGHMQSYEAFNGTIDEVRFWKTEDISINNLINQAYDPGASYGTSYSSSYDNLYISYQFNKISPNIGSGDIINDAPNTSSAALVGSTLAANGFTTSSYTRLSRNVRQLVPVVGATVYTNNKIKVAPPPVFNPAFVSGSGVNRTITLSPNKSIKSLTDKIYTSGLNLVNFGVSPADYINQDIIRNIGTVDVNTSIGNNRDLKDGKYDNLDKIFRYYLNNYYKSVNVNEFIDFYDNLAQAPAENVPWLSPARAKVLTGIIIESPLLSRKKLILNRSISVGGSNSKALDSFVSGSDVDFGVYAGEVELNVPTQIAITGSWSSLFGSMSIVLFTPSSSNQYYESNNIDTNPIGTASAGYARHAFLDEIEEDPTQPLYNIPPRSDLLDYGVTTYFHKKNSIYEFITTTPFKQYYLAKLDVSSITSIDPQYSKITLLPTSSVATLPGRQDTSVGTKELAVGQTETGLVNIANIFSLLGVVGVSGSRVRLYQTAEQRDVLTEASRSYSVTPDTSAGVLFDAVLTGESDVNPPLLIQTNNSTIYYRIDNTTSNKIITDITLSYFAYQPIDSIPTGYLPRHYRFSRDNTTPLKRRNYIGCKATVTDRVTDPLGRVGIERPFYSTTSDYESVDVFKQRGGIPPTRPVTSEADTRQSSRAPSTPAPTPNSGPASGPRLTSLLGRILGRNT